MNVTRAFRQFAMMVFFVAVSEALLSSAFASGTLSEFYRGVRPMGMGNAFTAIADDADAVFYNPAGIAYNTGIQMRLLNPKLDFSADDYTASSDLRKVSSSGFDVDAMKKLFGKNIYGDISMFPSVLLPHLTLGYLIRGSMHAVANNLSLPRVDLNYYLDQGFVGGTGFETRGISWKHFFRFGATVKVLTRRGYQGQIPLVSLISNGGGYLKSLKSAPDTGYGVDIGFQYEIPLAYSLDWISGIAWHDLGDTKFGTRLSSNNPPPEKNNLTLGTAFIFYLNRWGDSNFKLSFEGRHMELSGDEDPRKQTHMGAELKLGFLKVQLGMNEFSWTAGLGLDFWLAEAQVASYAVENGAILGMNTERRYMLQATFKLGTQQDGNHKRIWNRRKRPRKF